MAEVTGPISTLPGRSHDFPDALLIVPTADLRDAPPHVRAVT